MEKNKKYKVKGAGVLLIAAILLLTSVAVTANTMDEKEEVPISIVDYGNQEMIVKNKHENSGYKYCEKGVLWDNGDPDGINGISCFYNPPSYDREVIDDFTVPEGGWEVCGAHFSVITYSIDDPSAISAVKVFFYPGTGEECIPDTEAYAELDTTHIAYLTGAYYFDRPEIAVDCYFDCVNLTEGEWWVCLQPRIKENCFWLTAFGYDCSIYVSFPDWPYPKWTFGLDAFGALYDMAFKLTEEFEPPEPHILCAGKGLNWGNRDPEEKLYGQISVCNDGDEGSKLNWYVDKDSLPTWGTWVISPDSGTDLLEPSCEPLTVEVTLTDQEGDYTGVITIKNADNSSDYCELTTSVSVVVPRARTTHNQFILNLLQQFPVLNLILKIIFGA